MIGYHIYMALTTQSIITHVVNDRVFPVVMPQSKELPAIVYSINGAIPSHTNDGPSTLDKFQFQVFCIARSYKDVDDLAARVRSSLHGYNAETVQSILYQSEADDYEPETMLYIRAMNFTIRQKILNQNYYENVLDAPVNFQL